MTHEELAVSYLIGGFATAIMVALAFARHNARAKLREQLHWTEQVMGTLFSAAFWPFVAFLFFVLTDDD